MAEPVRPEAVHPDDRRVSAPGIFSDSAGGATMRVLTIIWASLVAVILVVRGSSPSPTPS
ncbi:MULTISPECIES: hypothetical protein [unclassified Pseudonocardia]|uniref:hypothetical protein n=1 Tax=unclassified Pseudonocardia TaxID=2619320 RepID=UPI001ACC971F|nr:MULTISPECIES: hypothetical protein [unclassified Pseudonocardia]MBN9102231.1 hypothetical protein [Pseudonocardia sp.]